MEEFVKKGNKYYRNNSDGTLTQVTPTKEGYFTWVLPDGKKVRSQRKYKIITSGPSSSQEEPSFWDKVKKGFVNATIGASVAEAPAVQIANGWYIDDKGDWKQDPERPGAKQLRSLGNPIPYIANWALSRSGGTNNVSGAMLAILGNTVLPGYDTRYYTGRVYTPVIYTNAEYNDKHGTTELETKVNPKERNYIRASTLGDFSGFTPSTTKGRYLSIPEFRHLPAVVDRFYTDTIYAPKESKPNFDTNIGKSFRLSTDSTLNRANYRYINDTYDARNHYITFNKDELGLPHAFMEDIFNTNNSFVDRFLLTPIIVNQNPLILFTDDLEKLTRVPYLSNWFLNPRNIESATQDSFSE